MKCHLSGFAPCAGLLLLAARPAAGGVNYEEAPIDYSRSPANNLVSRLNEEIQSRSRRLAWQPGTGYLASLLEALKVPVSSQVLVFSKTSLQDDKIGPTSPRAIYFNDDVHIGFVQGGLLEIAASDPDLGMVFYTLEQSEQETPQFQRRTNNCLTCHGAARTRNVPGLLVRSVFPNPEGQPVIAAGSFLTVHSSPLRQRWGGWYVTGEHGDQEHLGNYILTEPRKPRIVENQAGMNLRDLSSRFDTSRYLSPHSDLVALLVLEHQAEMHNVLTKAAFEARHALWMRQQAGLPAGNGNEAGPADVEETLNTAARSVVAALTFQKELNLTAPISGTSAFADEFARGGPPIDSEGSLRQLDLRTRLFRHHCSYMIESAAFRALPSELRSRVVSELKTSLLNPDAMDREGRLRTWQLVESSLSRSIAHIVR